MNGSAGQGSGSSGSPPWRKSADIPGRDTFGDEHSDVDAAVINPVLRSPALGQRPKMKPILGSLQGRLRTRADTPTVHLKGVPPQAGSRFLRGDRPGDLGDLIMKDRAIWIPAIAILSVPFIAAVVDWFASSLGLFRHVVDLLV